MEGMKRRIRQIVEGIPIFGRWLMNLYHLFRERFSHRSLSFWINRAVPEELAQVVQIGSNDGKHWDPIHTLILRRRKWKGLFVEAVPYLFEQLKENYPKDERFRFENALINRGEQCPFYWVDERAAREAIPDLPIWSNMLASMNRDHIVRHMNELEPFIRETTLKGLSLSDLLKKHEISALDILHIDTEGADYLILSQLDLSCYRPKVIVYEQCHLSPGERAASIALLQAFYDIYHFEGDYLAIEKSRAATVGQLVEIADLKVQPA